MLFGEVGGSGRFTLSCVPAHLPSKNLRWIGGLHEGRIVRTNYAQPKAADYFQATLLRQKTPSKTVSFLYDYHIYIILQAVPDCSVKARPLCDWIPPAHSSIGELVYNCVIAALGIPEATPGGRLPRAPADFRM